MVAISYKTECSETWIYETYAIRNNYVGLGKQPSFGATAGVSILLGQGGKPEVINRIISVEKFSRLAGRAFEPGVSGVTPIVTQRALAPSLLLACLCLVSAASESFEVTDNLEVSGFVRVIGGYLNSDNHSVEGYRDGFSLHQQSLIAIQPTYHVTGRLSGTVQWIGHSGEGRESGVEWAYLTYDFNDQWQIKAGKLRMPLFYYSDSIDVGYSYSWISPPMQLYNNKLFPTFEGGNISYSASLGDYSLRLEGLYGYYNNDYVMIGGTRLDAEARIDDMYGFNLNLGSGSYNVRLAYHTGMSKTSMDFLKPLQTALAQAGFTDSAATLAATGPVEVYSVGLNYESFSGFLRGEWVRTVTELNLSPTQTSYYITVGKYLDDWTLHLTFACAENTRTRPSAELQPYVADPTLNPMLAQLAAGYYYTYERIPTGGLNSVTVGTRWDFRPDMAFKLDVSYLKETSPYSGFFISRDSDYLQNSETRTGTLYQIGWEWVF